MCLSLISVSCLLCFVFLPLHFATGLVFPVRTPEFSELKRRFPPPTLFVPQRLGGVSNHRLRRWTGFDYVQNFENLRLCWTLNSIGGLHRIRRPKVFKIAGGVILPQFAVQKANQSGQLFVLSDFDIGPYLTSRYGNPELRRVALFRNREMIVASMANRRGIVRFIMNGGKSARVGLWMCDQVLFTHDQFYHPNMERVEFWPSDWACENFESDSSKTVP